MKRPGSFLIQFTTLNEVVKSRKSDGTVKSFRCKARKRRRWTFYEAVNLCDANEW